MVYACPFIRSHGQPDAMSTPSGFLDGVSLFDCFSPEERANVESSGRVFAVPAGTVLMHEGDEAQSLFVLLDGTVQVVRADPLGEPVVVGFRVAGECFGEMALIDGGTRSATVIAASPVRVFELEREVFLALISPSPQLLSKLLAELSRQIRSVSERVVREDLERRTRVAEAAVARHRAITQAVTGLAHELNTPLGVCVLAASHLQELVDGGAETVREPSALLRENLNRAVELVEAFSAIAASHSFEPLEALDLLEVVRQSALLFGLEQPGSGVTIAVQPCGPCPWVGYGQHLQRTLLTLFANAAAHAYPAGGGSVEVKVSADTLDGKPAWSLSVQDRGVGIPREHRGRLTDAFFTTARHRGHKGLGLTVAYNTVTGPLAGRLTVQSPPETGTCVTILVPQSL